MEQAKYCKWTLEHVHAVYELVSSDSSSAPTTEKYWTKAIPSYSFYPALVGFSPTELLELWTLVDQKIHGNLNVLADLMKNYESATNPAVLNYFFFGRWSSSDTMKRTVTIPVVPLQKVVRFKGIDLNSLQKTNKSLMNLTDHFNHLDRAAYKEVFKENEGTPGFFEECMEMVIKHN